MYVDPVAFVAGLAAAGVAAVSLVTALVTLAREVRTLRATPPVPSPTPPAARAPLPTLPPEVTPHRTPPGPRVLVVDDEPSFARLVRRLLSEHGVTVDIARDGAEARAMVAAHPHALVIVDLGLPGEGGLSVLAAIRQRTMVYSGATDEELERLRAAGAADVVLGKGADLEPLEAAVLDLLGLPRA